MSKRGKKASKERKKKYAEYTTEMLEMALEALRSKKVSSYEAEKTFGIPRRTLLDKLNQKHPLNNGGQTWLTEAQEDDLVKVLTVSADFGSPLTKLDLRLLVHRYLMGNHKNNFGGKLPGPRWVEWFIKRNEHRLTCRVTQNIKQSRAEKNTEEMTEYFKNLEKSLEGVPKENILNYDETNLSDDPGNSRGLFRRGIKYPERVMNSTKGAISIMFAITAGGECLPPYVVYKAEHLYQQWTENGPKDARFNRSKSGWFDSTLFEDWFMTTILPWSKTKSGPKILIGDNLASHMNIKIVKLCEENDIRFVFLPPNSSHLTQPLDVCYFGPLKKLWRATLLNYKMRNPRQATINKCHFPVLLKELMTSLEEKNHNIYSAFRSTGIYPLDPYEVLKKLPDYQAQEEEYSVDKALLEYLQESRAPNPMKKVRNKKLKVEPGKSVSSEDFRSAYETTIAENGNSGIENDTISNPDTTPQQDSQKVVMKTSKTLKDICLQKLNQILAGKKVEKPKICVLENKVVTVKKCTAGRKHKMKQSDIIYLDRTSIMTVKAKPNNKTKSKKSDKIKVKQEKPDKVVEKQKNNKILKNGIKVNSVTSENLRSEIEINDETTHAESEKFRTEIYTPSNPDTTPQQDSLKVDMKTCKTLKNICLQHLNQLITGKEDQKPKKKVLENKLLMEKCTGAFKHEMKRSDIKYLDKNSIITIKAKPKSQKKLTKADIIKVKQEKPDKVIVKQEPKKIVKKRVKVQTENKKQIFNAPGSETGQHNILKKREVKSGKKKQTVNDTESDTTNEDISALFSESEGSEMDTWDEFRKHLLREDMKRKLIEHNMIKQPDLEGSKKFKSMNVVNEEENIHQVFNSHWRTSSLEENNSKTYNQHQSEDSFSDTDNECLSTVRKRVLDLQNSNDNVCTTANNEDLTKEEPLTRGTYVIVKFDTNKSVRHFVGKIDESDIAGWSIRFLRKRRDCFVWPQADDYSYALMSDIITALPFPIEGRRGKLSFKFDFSIYNIF